MCKALGVSPSKCKNLFYKVVHVQNDLKNSKKPNHIGIGGATGKGIHCSLKPSWYRDEKKKAYSTTQKMQQCVWLVSSKQAG